MPGAKKSEVECCKSSGFFLISPGAVYGSSTTAFFLLFLKQRDVTTSTEDFKNELDSCWKAFGGSWGFDPGTHVL